MLVDLKKLRPHELAIILISLWGIFEFIYAPHPHYSKEVGLFPAFRMGPYTLAISETLVWGFFGLFFLLVLEKVVKYDRINLGPKEFSYSVLIFLFLVILSLLQGLANRNLNLLIQFRVFFPNLLILFFLNLAVSSNVEKIVFKITTLGGVLILILGMINYYFPGVINNYTIKAESYDIWFALYLVVWLFSISLSRLIFINFNIFWFFLMGISTVVVLLNLTNKPIIFATFISAMVIFLLGIFSNIRVVRFRTITFCSLGLFVLIIGFYMISGSFKTDMVQILASRYFKTKIADADEIGHAIALSELGGSEKDVSGGRLDIWKSYLKLACTGVGFSPKGLGASAQIKMHGAIFKDKPAHNRIVYLAYHFGFIAAFIFVIIVFRFIKNGFLIFRRYRPIDCYGFSMDKLIGIFSFIVAVLASEMVGGPVNNPRFAWFFWFFVFVILKRWQKLKLF